MCDPVTMAVVGGASAGMQALGARQQARMQYQAAKQQAEMQRRYQAQAAAAERQRALQEQTSLRMRQAQEQEAVGRELEQVSRKSQAALARARVSAGEAGVAGASVDALMGDYLRQEAGYRSALLRQQELSGIGTGLGLEQVGLASQQRLIGINQPIAEPVRPRGLGIQDVLSVASGGLSGYMMGRQLSGPAGDTTTLGSQYGGSTSALYKDLATPSSRAVRGNLKTMGLE
jgi:multidrug efflux pump subunit AcrA (membrane-fusion protein)